MTKKLPPSVRRAERKKEKKLNDMRKALSLIDKAKSTVITKTPRAIATPQLTKIPISPKAKEIESGKKMKSIDPWIKIAEYAMTWCDSESDREGRWAWGETRDWSPNEWEDQIYPTMKSMESQTWNQIINEMKTKARRGKSVPYHHQQELDTLIKEAQDRWISLGLDQYDTLFRFRLGSTRRAWGIRLGSHFFLVWYERNHKIYPV